MGLVGLRMLCAWTCLLVAAIAAGEAAAQWQNQSGRRLALFDFEDKDDAGQPIGESYPMPVSWYALGREPLEDDPNFLEQARHRDFMEIRGFPSYAEVGFSGEHARSGDYSMHLGLDGGNAGAYLRTGVLPAVPESTYAVHANLRTERLDRAAAVLSASYVNAEGEVVRSTVVRSQPVTTGGRWRRVSVQLAPAPPEAAWIGIEVMVLQRRMQEEMGIADEEAGATGVKLEQIRGGAWFDDIGVWQLPHIDVTTQHPTQVIRAPERPELSIQVRDLTGQRLTAELAVYDEYRRRVATTRRQVGGGAPTRWRWTPDLPGLGWYMLDLRIFESGKDTPIARKVSSLLWTPADAGSDDALMRPYALLADDLSPRYTPMLPDLLDRVGIRSVTLPAWQEEPGQSIAQQQSGLADVLKKLSASAVEPTLSFSRSPQPVAAQMGVDRIASLAELLPNDAVWERYVVPILARQGQQVRSWQIASPGLAGPGHLRQDEARAILEQLSFYAPSPTAVVPVSVHESPPGDLEGRFRYLVNIPPSVQADELAQQLADWTQRGDQAQALLRIEPANRLTQSRRIADLVLRMLALREAEIEGAAIASPYAVSSERDSRLLPDPLLGAFAGAARRLAGREVLGRLPMPEGLEAVILADPERRRGALMVWNRAAREGDNRVEVYLGQQPVLMDVWGNAAALPLVDGRHPLRVRDIPRFVENIDLELARFRAGFTINEPLIVSEQTEHRRFVTLVNPWPRTISGSLRFTGPEGWDVQPIRHSFSIPAGGSVRLPVVMTFPLHEVAGRKTLTAEVDFVADRRYRVQLWTPLELGLPDVEFDASLTFEASSDPAAAPDALVTCLITNTGDAPRSLYVFANLFDHPRQERVVARLEPGESVVRRFRFETARDELLDYPLRTGIRETNGPAILNKRLDLSDG